MVIMTGRSVWANIIYYSVQVLSEEGDNFLNYILPFIKKKQELLVSNTHHRFFKSTDGYLQSFLLELENPL